MNETDNRTYADGVIEGRLTALEHMQSNQNLRLDQHHHRISNLERAMWIVIGAIAAMEFLPLVADFIRRAASL